MYVVPAWCQIPWFFFSYKIQNARSQRTPEQRSRFQQSQHRAQAFLSTWTINLHAHPLLRILNAATYTERWSQQPPSFPKQQPFSSGVYSDSPSRYVHFCLASSIVVEKRSRETLSQQRCVRAAKHRDLDSTAPRGAPLFGYHSRFHTHPACTSFQLYSLSHKDMMSITYLSLANVNWRSLEFLHLHWNVRHF